MKLDLSAIEARASKATKEPWVTGSIPWKVWAHGGHATVCDVRALGGVKAEICEWEAASNRDFIAAARTDVPALVNAVRDLGDRLRRRIARCHHEHGHTDLCAPCNTDRAALVAAGLKE